MLVMDSIEEQLQQSDWIDFNLVARITGLHRVLLRKLVRDGVLPGDAPYRTKTVEGCCDLNEARRIAAQLDAARKPVEGQGITALEAIKKYSFGRTTIYDWYDRGWVTVAGTTPDGDRLFNEGDIAFARALADLVGNKSGKPLLPAKE